MKTATHIKDLTNFRGFAALYHLNEPLDSFSYVVVSAVNTYFGPETYIFGSDENGQIDSWIELHGSYRGGLNHETALGNAGYVLEESDSGIDP